MSPILKKILLPVLVGILAIANLVVWSGRLFRGENYNNDIITMNDLNTISLKERKIKLSDFKPVMGLNTTLLPRSLNSRLNVLVFFSLNDCPLCLYESVYWGEAARMYNRTEVSFFGITNETDRKRIDSFLNSNRITFPIFIDINWKFKNKILELFNRKVVGAIKTPFKIFLNSSHEIIYIQTAQKNTEDQRLFPLFVSKIFTGP
jgi:peroxiredoxin